MKKIISLVLALALVCGLAVNAVAANVDVSVDKDVISVGDTVVVTITLDEEIPAEVGTTSVQCVLGYDKAVLTYVDGTAGEGYSWLTFNPSNRKDEIKINSGTDFSVKTLPAGTVAVVTFTANETTTAADLALTVSLVNGLSTGESVEIPGDSVEVTVCPNHSYEVTAQTEATCEVEGSVTYTCASCGDSYTETVGGEHDLVHQEAVDPACHYTGNIEHWYCKMCEQVWQDEALTQLTNHKSVIIPALGGDVVHVEAVAPSCEVEGNIEYWYCEKCEQVWQDEALTQLTNHKNVIIPATCQNVVHVEAVDPGCHYTGNIEHWYCTDCGTVWSDEARTQITNHKNVVIPALGGDVVHVEAVAATCSANGNIEYWYCEECEQVWQDEALTQLTNRMNVVLPAGHNIVHVEAVEPGCHSEGNVEHWYCTGECGTVWTDEELTEVSNHKNVVIPALGGDVVYVEAVDPGCHYTGNIEHWYCEECEKVWQDEALTQLTNHKNVILPALGGDVVHVEAVAATCSENGNIEYWYCEECEQVWQDEALTQLTNHKNVILPSGHNIVHVEAVEPGCHYEGNVEHWYCTGECGTVWTDEELTKVSNHLSVILPELGGEVIHVEAAEADCRNPGHIEYWYCEECDQVWQDEARTQLTNHKNVITEAALGFVDEDKDGVCDICGSSNPHTGDVSIIVAAAAAVISMTGIVALPIAKKKFF